jgi:hypothetical protein
MNIQNNNMKPATSQYYVQHPIINKLNPLTCVYVYLMHKKPCTPFMVLIPLSVEKYVFPCCCSATALPLNLTYIWIVPSKLSLGSPPYTNSSCFTFQISCPYSFAQFVGFSANFCGLSYVAWCAQWVPMAVNLDFLD